LWFIFAFSLCNIQPLEFEFEFAIFLCACDLQVEQSLGLFLHFCQWMLINILLPSLGNSTIMLLVVNDLLKKIMQSRGGAFLKNLTNEFESFFRVMLSLRNLVV
jgi:hypothetical protein